MTRFEFGFQRTVCACHLCTLNCQFIPGYLIPQDVRRLADRFPTAEDLWEYASGALLASPGAKVAVVDNNYELREFHVPTIVPGRRGNGWCINLNDEKQCTIHDDAPFGCAFFDAHQTMAQSDEVSRHGLNEIMRDFVNNGPYTKLWQRLWDAGRRAMEPTKCRQQMAAAMYAAATGKEKP